MANITINIHADVLARLDRIVEKCPLSNRHAVAGAAIRYALEQFEDEPELVVQVLQGQRVRLSVRERLE